MQKLSHESYLKGILDSKKKELREHEVEQRIYIAVAFAKSKILMEQIDSIEKQLID